MIPIGRTNAKSAFESLVPIVGCINDCCSLPLLFLPESGKAAY